MKTTTVIPLMIITVLGCVASTKLAVAQTPEPLFSDTFTAADSNMNVYAGGGQSGTLTTPIGYTFTGAEWQTQISGNNAVIFANGNTASFSLAHNFTDAQHLTIFSTFSQPQATGWIKFGAAPNTDFNVAGGAAFVLNSAGNALFYDGASNVASFSSVVQPSNTLLIEMISSANYDGSGSVTISAWLNDIQLDLNGAGPGDTYTTSGGFTQNYITFAQFSPGFNAWNVQDWQVDVVPEPSTYALLVVGAAGIGAHVFRRRRRC
jgi:hypothetical protein